MRTEVVRVDMSVGPMYCAWCSADELERIRSLDPGVLDTVARAAVSRLDVRKPLRPIPFVCFGSKLEVRALPCGLGPILKDCRAGWWWPALGAVIINLRGIGDCSNRLRAVLVHEFAHAVMGTLSRPYVYPRAIDEAFALTIERDFADSGSNREVWNMHRDPAASRPCRGRLRPSQRVRGLLTARTYPQVGRRFFAESFALMAFLDELNRLGCRSLDGWLVEMRCRRLNGPRTYEWLQEKLGCSAEAMEEAFRRFVLTGEVSLG